MKNEKALNMADHVIWQTQNGPRQSVAAKQAQMESEEQAVGEILDRAKGEIMQKWPFLKWYMFADDVTKLKETIAANIFVGEGMRSIGR